MYKVQATKFVELCEVCSFIHSNQGFGSGYAFLEYLDPDPRFDPDPKFFFFMLKQYLIFGKIKP